MFSAAAVPCPAGTPPRLAWLARAGAAKASPCTRPRAAPVRAQARRLPVRSLPCAVQAPPAVCRPAPSNDVRPRREPRQRLRVSPLRGGAARRPTCHHPTRAPTTCRSSSSLAKYTEASFQDRVRPPQLGALLSEPLQLFGSSVVSRSRRRPLSGLGLPHPVAQRRHPSAVRPDAWAWSLSSASGRPGRGYVASTAAVLDVVLDRGHLMVWHCRGAGELRTTTSTWQGGTSYRCWRRRSGGVTPTCVAMRCGRWKPPTRTTCFPNASG